MALDKLASVRRAWVDEIGRPFMTLRATAESTRVYPRTPELARSSLNVWGCPGYTPNPKLPALTI